MHPNLNNVMLITSLILRQSRFLKAKNYTYVTRMSNSSYLHSSKLVFSTFGDPNKVVEMQQESIFLPKKDEILVRIMLAPVNPADMNTIQGTYPIKPELPAVPGNEGVGVISSVGPEVKNFEPGDRVIPDGEALGMWRTHAIFKANQLFKVRDDVDYVDLAGISSNPCTAYRMLKDFVDLKEGDIVIQNGANSAAGQNVIQLCNIWGVKTVNVVRNRPDIDKLRDYLKDLGATYVFTEEELRTSMSKLEKKPVLGLNAIGGKSALEVLRNLNLGGTMVTYGGMSRDPVTVPTSALIFKDVKIRGFWMTRWTRENRQSEVRKVMLEELMSYMRDKKLKAPKHQLVPLKEYRIALLNTMNLKGFSGMKYILDMREVPEAI